MTIPFKRLFADRSGASVIELGLAAPLLCFLLLGSVDMALGYAERLSLQQAANRAIEMATVRGQINSSYSYLQAHAAAASDEPAGNVTVDNWLACDDVRQTSYDGVCGGNQQIARYVSVRIVGTHQPFLDYSWLANYFGAPALAANKAIAGDATVRVQ